MRLSGFHRQLPQQRTGTTGQVLNGDLIIWPISGLWTIDDDLRIRVAQSDITESILPGGSHFKLADLHGRRLSFAPQATLRPDPIHLAWHRREVFAH
jgi:hypothetical protein